MNYADFALIRFGSGLSPRFDGPATPDALMDSLGDETTRAAFPVPSTEEILTQLEHYNKIRRGPMDDEASRKAFEQERNRIKQLANTIRRIRLARAIDAPVGFSERLAQFWSSHFSLTGAAHHVLALNESFQDEVIRTHQNGLFADLLRAATFHPAMLRYLNQTESVGPASKFARKKAHKNLGLNENHARELLELHTLGVGSGYNQADVRQLAELMTGLVLTKEHRFIFSAARAEPGSETVLGKDYGGAEPAQQAEIEAFLNDLAVHPRTAAFICGKLARHFCSDAPPDKLVEAMTERYRSTGGNLIEVYAVMVGHKDARDSFGQKVRQPYDFIAAGFRSLGAAGTMITDMKFGQFRRTVIGPLRAMGQPVNGAPQPEGWPEDEASWLTPQQLAGRINWALDTPRAMFKSLPDVAGYVATALPDTRAEQIGPIAARAETQAEGIAMVLASPQFNRR